MNSENLNTAKAILPATEGLLQEISGNVDFALIKAFKNAVLRFGSKADAEVVLQHFLRIPTGSFAGDLLEIVGRWGNLSHAQKLYDFSLSHDRLNENFPEAVLEVLGQLKFEPAKPALAWYAFNSSDHYINRAAVLGLLHFDCSEYKEQIKNIITSIPGQNLFPEYLPALICKLDDRKELLEQLYTSGSTITSTDCNAGIFLGFSLCGEEGKGYFKKALFDPNWEAYYNAARVVLQGMQHLGISFEELLQEAIQVKEEKELEYYMMVLTSLLEIKVDTHENSGESFEKIYRDLFVTRIFPGLAEKAGQQEDAEKVEELLILRMQGEVLLRNIRK